MMRLLTIVFALIVSIHISACSWYLTYRISNYSPDSWVVRRGLQDDSNQQKYLSSLYWSLATVFTVGYGDINGYTDIERIFSIAWMLIGVALYAFVIGFITTVIDRIDTRESNLNAKLDTFDMFCNEAEISLELKHKVKDALEYQSNKNSFSVIQQKHS